MSEFYDSLEMRSSDERNQAQLEAIREQIRHVQNNTVAYSESLKEIDASKITDATSFSELPLTRKSELIELQQAQRPFGGYTTSNASFHSHVFASPGPIYEPGFAVADFWRFARSLYASGFRSGDLVHQLLQLPLYPCGTDV